MSLQSRSYEKDGQKKWISEIVVNSAKNLAGDPSQFPVDQEPMKEGEIPF